MIDLPFIWAGLIAFAILAYVILDGFDLGIGILYPFFGIGKERDEAMNSVSPVWDGNETWLVLGGGGLFAAFPLAYSTILPALYAPLIFMLLGLVLRGVAFEFRWKTQYGRSIWDASFAIGSTMAAFCQGIALGAFVQGIKVTGRAYSGDWWDWLTPFSILTGFALVAGYALLGACWLVMKTEGSLYERAKKCAHILSPVTIGFIGLVSLCTPFLNPQYMERWFNPVHMLALSPVPLLVIAAWFVIQKGLKSGPDHQAFLAALGLFVLCYIGLGISIYPYMVPPGVTLWEAANPDNSLGFMLVGAVVLVPLILAYNVYAYWVFRGKSRMHDGYHE
jgi:cytochrome d ubiquinol oxidase subunit II